MKTMEDINELLKDYPKTEEGEGCLSFAQETDNTVTEAEVVDGMYNFLKGQIDSWIKDNKTISVRVHPEVVGVTGTDKRMGYFRMQVI